MQIEFVSKREFNFLKELAVKLGCTYDGDVLTLPLTVGLGFVKLVDLDSGLKLTIHRHRLKEQWVIKRNASPERNNLVTITFNAGDRPIVYLRDVPEAKPIKLSSVFITSTDIGLETRIEPDQHTHSTIIIIHTSLLLSFVEGHTDNELIRKLAKGDRSCWMATEMNPRIQDLLFQLDNAANPEYFSHLFYRIKVQQLIYELFVGLLEKEKRPFQSIKATDIEKMYFIRESLVSNLSNPPSVTGLARQVCMSGTKMNSLFRQVFGKSIYNYYQNARLEEASKLLRDLSVAETSYKLGFINPSYFSRLFAKRFNMRPKKFSDTFYSKGSIATEDSAGEPR
jgi:AraC-like DNA-binding protein